MQLGDSPAGACFGMLFWVLVKVHLTAVLLEVLACNRWHVFAIRVLYRGIFGELVPVFGLS